LTAGKDRSRNRSGLIFGAFVFRAHIGTSGKAIQASTQSARCTLKRILSIVGGLFLVLVLLAAGFFGYAAYQGRGLDASSKAYVQENVPAIISTWSKDELLKRSSPQLQKSINEKPEQLDQLFQKLSTLGPMQSFDELVKGDSNVFYNVQGGKVITAAYVATAKFKNGEGHIKVRLIQSPTGQWQFLQFYVDSPFFLH
jgi:hypothetical protein